MVRVPLPTLLKPPAVLPRFPASVMLFPFVSKAPDAVPTET